MRLGVNIDHVATLRQARREDEPDLLAAAKAALQGGADGITVHLREDRRHIQDKDVRDLMSVTPYLNLEMAATEEMLTIATALKPAACCLVPEKRQELTTEGGLNIKGNYGHLKTYIPRLQKAGIKVSLFINPDEEIVRLAADLGTDNIEIHTGIYAKQALGNPAPEIEKIHRAVALATSLKLGVHAGHGLKYYNVRDIATIKGIEELNIGHSIISRALFCGMENAVREMKDLIMAAYRQNYVQISG